MVALYDVTEDAT